ncbi:MAG: hypothetical protein LBQ75_00920 [Zoogloeaceae bacterium]|jgi:hypothetical protein|nr:hypothetical protein [Zoogloeaceae bacterium]
MEPKDAQTLMNLVKNGQVVLCNLAPDMFCPVVAVQPDKMLVTLVGPDGDELKEVTNSLVHAARERFFVTQEIPW